MKKDLFRFISVVGLLMICFMLAPQQAKAGVHVDIDIPLPRLFIPLPPPLLVIPGTNVYYPPDVREDIFFYQGHWYRSHNNRWYLGEDYNGPWKTTHIDRVPRYVRGLPPTYRNHPRHYEPEPYGRVRENWRTWEKDRHWERNENKRERREDRDERHDERRGRNRD